MRSLKGKLLVMLSTVIFTNLIYAALPDTDIHTQAALKWYPVKDMPPGAEIALLSGDPTKHEHFIARVKFPANYIVPAHSHAINEFDTIIAGTYYIGMGTVADGKNGTPLETGDFAMVPANVKHFGYTKTPTIIQISAVGPWGMIYDTNG